MASSLHIGSAVLGHEERTKLLTEVFGDGLGGGNPTGHPECPVSRPR